MIKIFFILLIGLLVTNIGMADNKKDAQALTGFYLGLETGYGIIDRPSDIQRITSSSDIVYGINLGYTFPFSPQLSFGGEIGYHSMGSLKLNSSGQAMFNDEIESLKTDLEEFITIVENKLSGSALPKDTFKKLQNGMLQHLAIIQQSLNNFSYESRVFDFLGIIHIV